MRNENMRQRKEAAVNMFDFATFLVFQRLTQTQFVHPNTTEISVYGPLLND
jgi:hypothetical protein